MLKFQIYGATWTEWGLSLYEVLIIYVLVQPALHCLDHNSKCKPNYMSHSAYETVVYVTFCIHALWVLGPLYAQTIYKILPTFQYVTQKYTQSKWVFVWNTLLIVILKLSDAISICISTLVVSYVCVLIPLHFTNFFLAT